MQRRQSANQAVVDDCVGEDRWEPHQASGGPCSYNGLGMKSVYRAWAYQRRVDTPVDDLVTTMDKLKVSERE
jgi:hypothetical protein